MTVRTRDYLINTSSGVLKDNTTGDIEPVDLRDAIETLFAFASPIAGTIETAANVTYTIDMSADTGYTITGLKIKSTSGSCTAAVRINGTNVTGLSAVAVGTTITNPSASGANTVAAANDMV